MKLHLLSFAIVHALFGVFGLPSSPIAADVAVVAGVEIRTQIESGAVRSLRVDRVAKDPNSDGQLYWLTTSEAGEERPLCSSAEGAALSAIPLNGSWDQHGRWRTDGLTFACYNGVLAKCVRWGYAPWGRVGDMPLRDYHQACTRMARADYCGDGVSHTRDGTLINMWDELGIQNSDRRDDLHFEAAWAPDGAHGIARTRYPDDMAYVEANCPERLAGRAITASVLLWNESIPKE
jgi:hypothetical protein